MTDIPGRTPDQRLHDPRAQATAERLNEQTRQAEHAAHAGGHAPASGLAVYGVLACGAWMALGTVLLGYPTTETGYDNVLYSLGGGIVALLAGLWLVNVARTRWVAVVCVVVGALEVFVALGLPHDQLVTALQTGITGALLMLSASVVALAPRGDGRRATDGIR